MADRSPSDRRLGSASTAVDRVVVGEADGPAVFEWGAVVGEVGGEVGLGDRSPKSGPRVRFASAFVKTPIDGPVRLGRLGLPGDEHVYEDHGGPDMAALVYPVEHYAHWRRLGLELPDAAALGENLTVSGLVETDVHLGDVFEVGTAVVQVCQPRTPCHKLAARFGRTDMSVMVQNTGYTGYLLRVLAEGDVAAGDRIELVQRDRDHDVTVAEAGRIVSVDRNDREGAKRVLAVEALGTSVRRTLEARLGVDTELGLDTDRLFIPDE